MNKPIPVVVAGALGRMGAELVKTLQACADCELVAAIDTTPGQEGEDVGLALGLNALEVAVTADLEGSLCMASQQHPGSVLVDFTHPKVVYKHARAAIAYGVAPVIGTTGLSPEQIQDLADFAVKATMGAAVIPNFSVGMVLLHTHHQHAPIMELVVLLRTRHPHADTSTTTATPIAHTTTPARRISCNHHIY